ncbi:MAG: SGNH/GDSL hydrolase family protein [Kiritimatiellae bacterium]|nr:SGNH/GDSL hydrolase family protein [Kiritimatiellia bacterium]
MAGGHEEYFGTHKVGIPYRTLPPYYWIPVANTPITNNKGFRGRNWKEKKSAGVIRIASLGDSCTLGGQEPYSERLDRLLREALHSNKYEVLNGGVGSSSTYQMLQIFEQQILPMRPDIVVIFPGWNDRWVHDGQRDSLHKLPTPWQASMRNHLLRSRLFQAMVFVADKQRSKKKEQRVPASEMAANLRKFAKMCRDQNLALYLCTTPDGNSDNAILARFNDQKDQRDWDLDLYDLFKDKADSPIGVWRYLDALYNDTVRSVAANERLPLIDLATDVAQRRMLYPEPPLYFFKDGIHFTELGLQEVARLLALQITTGSERDAVAAYVDSGPYYATNALIFATQYQFATADDFLNKAEQLGEPPAWAETLHAQIREQRPFYDRYDRARINLSNFDDPSRVFSEFQALLEMRPQDQDLRLDTADMAKNVGEYELGRSMAIGQQVDYSPSNLNRALWIAAECSDAMGDSNMVSTILQELMRLFPEDQRLAMVLANLPQ